MATDVKEKVTETLQSELDQEPSRVESESGPADLGTFEDEDVLLSKIKVQGFGDGLSEAVGLKAHAYHRGDTIYLVSEVRVKRVEFEADPKTEELARIHTTRLVTAIEVDEKDVRTVMAIARDRKQAYEDSKSGQTSLLDGEGEPEGKGGPAGLGPDAEFNADDLPEGGAKLEPDAD